MSKKTQKRGKTVEPISTIFEGPALTMQQREQLKKQEKAEALAKKREQRRRLRVEKQQNRKPADKKERVQMLVLIFVLVGFVILGVLMMLISHGTFGRGPKIGVTYYINEALVATKSADGVTAEINQAYYTKNGGLHIGLSLANGMAESQHPTSIRVKLMNGDGEIITDATTAATFCYYCHNPVILGGRLSGEFLPDKIIPFEITKEEAVKKFLEYVGKKKFIPKAFFSKKQIESLTGVYFPYWNYSADVENMMQGEARNVRSWITGNIRYTETKHYHVSRQGVVSLTNLTENALQKANAELARGVMPYHFEKMQDFNMGYLSGFMAEKRDIEKDGLTKSMQGLAKNYADKMMRDTIKYDYVNIDNSKMGFKEEKWAYCLLPVWTITYKGKNGKIYYYSMNGQTGEVCGELPVDRKKLALVSGAVSAAIFILGLLGGLLT